MSTYPITDPLDILLSFTNAYFIPEAGASLTLRFGATGDAEIVSDPSEVLLFGTDHQVSIITEILFGQSELQVHSNSSVIETLIELQFGSFEIQMSSTPAVIETLVEIQSKLSEIQVSGTDSTLEVLVDIQAEHSEIKLVGTKQEISEIILILSEQSEIQIQNDDHDFEVLTELETEPSEITIKIPEHEVEHLPEVLTAASEFLTLSGIFDVGGGTASDLPNKLGHSGHRMPWMKAQNYVGKKFEQPWDDPLDICTKNKALWETPVKVSGDVKSPYINKMDFQDQHTRKPWGDFIHLSDSVFSVPFIAKMDFIDRFRKILWEGFVIRNRRTVNPYANTAAWRGDYKDSHKHKLWDTSRYYDKKFCNGFNNDAPGQIHDKHHGTFWGPYWYSLWCQEQYFPWESNEYIHLVLKSDFPLLTHPEFLTPSNPRCPFDYWYSGSRNGPIISPPPYEGPILPLVKGVYYMQNTVFVKRLPSMEDIEVYSVSISADMDSFVWDFSMEVADSSYLDLIKPQGDVFIDVQITINDYPWTCRIEEWSENTSFGQRTWTVKGRSPSIELTAPFSNTYSYVNNDNDQATALVTDLLNLTGWSYTWTPSDYMTPYTDWLIPAGAFSFTEKTTLDGIRQLTDAVGAFINTVPDTNSEQSLIIKPRYLHQPWTWGTAEVDSILVDSMCWEIARSYDRLVKKDHIILAGERNGVLGKVIKDGTAGTLYGGMISHPLFTTLDAVSERGRMELAESGNWVNHNIKFFSLEAAPDGIGLIDVGALVQMNESTTTWRGVVKGNSITVSKMTNTTAIDVYQELNIAEYIND